MNKILSLRAVKRSVSIILIVAILVTLMPVSQYVKAADAGSAADTVSGTDVALKASVSANGEHPEWGIAADNLNNGHEPSATNVPAGSWHDYGMESTDGTSWVQYDWNSEVTVNSMSVYWMCDSVWDDRIPTSAKVEYKDANGNWQTAGTYDASVMEEQKADQYNVLPFSKEIATKCIRMTMVRNKDGFCSIHRWKVWGTIEEEPVTEKPVITKTAEGYKMVNKSFIVETGKYGQITSLQLQGDQFPTNYVMNAKNSSSQNTPGHQWLGELMFSAKVGDAAEYTQQNTSRSDSGRTVELKDDKVVVTYQNSDEEKGIKDFKVVETYAIVDDKLNWEITVTNTNTQKLTIGDIGLPMPFNERWPGNEEIYETRTVDHGYVGLQSSYLYATRPSGLGMFLLMTPDASTDAGFEYKDHWRVEERAADEKEWCQDQGGWPSGLSIYYIHSDYIKKTNRGYLGSTKLELAPGESKTYAFNFSGVDNETDMKSTLYKEGIIDAVAVPGMTYSVNMPGKMYLHTPLSKDEISLSVQCPHEMNIFTGKDIVSNPQACKKTEQNTYVKYEKTVTVDNEQYHVYEVRFGDLGQNNVIASYNGGKSKAVMQFYMLDDVAAALTTHSEFMVNNTQFNNPLHISDKVFDDWMMDTKNKRAETDKTYWQKNYWGWGDDWALTHGEYIAEKNVYQPLAREIKAVDEYLDIAIWNGLMREHQKDYLIHDFLMESPNSSPTYRGYAYPHIYNTYFSMYKIASKYPNMIEYEEDADTYLLRAYNILKALYSEGVSYNWSTGVMGELTTPDIIAALKKEGYYNEAKRVTDIMTTKYKNFKDTKYPYGSEYSYDNTGEEAVYTLAKMNLGTDTANANSMMNKINLKTRACRGLQPVWYYYADPTTICGDNWWQFQYTAALAGYCMDDWLRLQNNGMTETELATASRVNYAAKLANLTCINSGQIDADPANIGAVAWTYQAELGNLGGQGTGGGKLHNGWRQMSGESDLGLFGALQILSSDVVIDPVFGLFGYGCEVSETGNVYTVTPLDGLFTRLNFINQKLYIELDRDQYTKAKVAADNTSIELSVKNLEATAHATDVNITGLKAGSYQILVNGAVTGSFQAVDQKTSTIKLALPAAVTAEVAIKAGTPLENTAPVVILEENKTVAFSDTVRLEAEASDDGYVNSTLSYHWNTVSSPEGATAAIETPDERITKVSFSDIGDYIFEFTANDGGLSTTKQIKVTVTMDPALPEVIADFTFDEETVIGINKLLANSTTGNLQAEIDDNSKLVEGKTGEGVAFTGRISGGYIELPEAMTKNLKKTTISVDVKLTDSQSNHTTLFELGDKVVVEFIDGNILSMTINGKNASTNVKFASNFWKNIELTADEDDYTLYINGVKKAEILDSGLNLAGIDTDRERYLIGRSKQEAEPFLKGIIDNFTVKSYVMTQEQLLAEYGNGEHVITGAKAATIVTTIGTEPVLPDKVNALYSDGVYELHDVVWNTISPESYAKAGTFTVEGTLKDTEVKITMKVIVAAGTLQNVAGDAAPSAIYNNPADLGGVKGLNDGFDPDNSSDTSHGTWHNWGGNNGAPAWVQYTWEEAQIITGMDAYFFRDGNGNFIPANYTVEYLNEEGSWCTVTNTVGLGTAVNKYNKTTFDAIVSKGLRMTMTPAKQGCGVIEWKVYAYKEGTVVDKSALNAAIKTAEGLQENLFTNGISSVSEALTAARIIADNKASKQKEVDLAAAALNEAIVSLKPIGGNMAFSANVHATYTSSWERLSSVNDGRDSSVSNSSECSHWGTWGHADVTGETVTYSWGAPIKLNSSQLYIWNDGGGITTPTKYVYEYLDSNGNWTQVTNAVGYDILLDGYNTTTFDEVVTTGIRVVLTKESSDAGVGLGLVEWRVLGSKIDKLPAVTITTDPAETSAIENDQSVIVRLNSSVTGSAISVTGSALTVSGSAIYYTLDGSEPNQNSMLYTGEFVVNANNIAGETIVIRAIEIAPGWMNSSEVTQIITFLPARVEPGKLSVPVIITTPADVTALDNSVKVKVKLASAVTGASIYFTTDGSAPGANSNKYTGEFEVKAGSKAANSKVIRAICIKEGWINSETAMKTITFLSAKTEPSKLSAPVITTVPADVTAFDNSAIVKVRLTSSISGASIYFTTDGSMPGANSSKYTGEFEVKADGTAAQSKVIRAICIKEGWINSEIATEKITFKAAKPTPSDGPTNPNGPGTSIKPISEKTAESEKASGDATTAAASYTSKTENGLVNISVQVDADDLIKKLTNVANTDKEILVPVITESILKKSIDKGINKVDMSVVLSKDILNSDKLEQVNLNLSEELLKTVKENGIDVVIYVKDETGKEVYSWSFSSKALADSKHGVSDVNLTLTLGSVEGHNDLKKLLKTTEQGEKGVVVRYNHEGILPSQASVRLYVGNLNNVENGKVYIYHYNTTTNKLDSLPYSSNYFVDADGYVSMDLLHCSEYVILTKPANKKAVTSLLKQIKVKANKKTLYVGAAGKSTAQLTAELPSTLELVNSFVDKTSSDAIGAVVISYKSSNNKVVKVDKKGKLTAVGKGTASISATVKLYSKKSVVIKAKITVKNASVK